MYIVIVTEDPVSASPTADGRGAVLSSNVQGIFLHLLAFTTLYIVGVGASVVATSLADYFFEDPIQRGFSQDTLRLGLAMLVVAYPVFLAIRWSIARKQKSGGIPIHMLVRSILGYLTLFVVTVTAVIDLTMIVYTFIGGGLTGRFFIKAISVLVVVGLGFAYCLFEVKENKGAAA